MDMMQEVTTFGFLNCLKPLRIISCFCKYLIADINQLTDTNRFAGAFVFVAANQFTAPPSFRTFLTLFVKLTSVKLG